MKILSFQNDADWMEARRAKVTGSTLKSIAPTGGVSKAQLVSALEEKGVEFKKSATIAVLSEELSSQELLQLEVDSMMGEKKMGYYQLIADRLADPTDTDEHPMDRGNQLEEEALKEFEKELGVDINYEKVLWSRDDNDKISISPDSYVLADKITTAIEVKCLSSAKHIKAKLTQEIPSDYTEQVKQYFVVNDDLEELHFVFYDPRFIEGLKLHSILVKREELADEIMKYHCYQIDVLKEIDSVVEQFTF